MYRIFLHATLIVTVLFVLCCEKTDNLVDHISSSQGSLQGEIEATESISFQVFLYQHEQLIAQTDAIDSFEFNEIEAGSYLLRITAPGYNDVELDVEIDAGVTSELEKITLQPTTETEIDPNRLEPGNGLKLGIIAPDFDLPDGNGNRHSLSEYLEKGQDVVLVFYRFGG